MEGFTRISGLIGGLLIGLSTVLLLLLNGRIAGISGIAGGLLLGAFVYMLTTGGGVPIEIKASLPMLVLAGLLVGFGAPGRRLHQQPWSQRHSAI